MNNAIIYNATVGGVLASNNVLRYGVSHSQDYLSLLSKATGLGGIVDGMIPPGPFSDLEGRVFQGVVAQSLHGRNLVGTTAFLTGIAVDIIALWNLVRAALVSENNHGGAPANRPLFPEMYDTYYNTTTKLTEIWDGTNWIVAVPSGWDDLKGLVVESTAVAALTSEKYRDTPVILQWFRHDQNDSLVARYQTPHNWMRDELEPHGHFIPGAAGGGNVLLHGRCAYSCRDSLPLPVWADWTPFSYIVPIGAQWMPFASSFDLFNPPLAARLQSSHFYIWLERSGTDPSDTFDGAKPTHTPQANLALEYLDAHAHLAGIGTVGRYG